MLVPGNWRTGQLPQQFARRAASILEITRKVCYPEKPTFTYVTREEQVPGASDGEGPMVRTVESPWMELEAAYINTVLLKNYWTSFTHAQERDFQNAVGKFFLEHYSRLCTTIIDQDLQVYHSTNPNGENQPGFARVGWCLPPRGLRTPLVLSVSTSASTYKIAFHLRKFVSYLIRTMFLLEWGGGGNCR